MTEYSDDAAVARREDQQIDVDNSQLPLPLKDVLQLIADKTEPQHAALQGGLVVSIPFPNRFVRPNKMITCLLQ